MEKIRLNFFDETLFFEKKRINMFKFFWNVSPHKKIWYLDITRINFLAGTLQGKKLL